jgi:hypothetical protein
VLGMTNICYVKQLICCEGLPSHKKKFYQRDVVEGKKIGDSVNAKSLATKYHE